MLLVAEVYDDYVVDTNVYVHVDINDDIDFFGEPEFSIQDPIAGTFVKEGRTLYFTVRRIGSEKIRIPEEVFDGKDKTYMKNNFGYNFKLVFIPENGSVDLVVKSLSSGGSNLVVGDSLIKGSTINVYLELDEDIDKDNRRFIDNLQSTDSIITE